MSRNGWNRWLLGGILCGTLLTAGKIHAEEETSQVLTAVSSTTISGYVDTEASFTSISMSMNIIRGGGNESEMDFRYLFGPSDRQGADRSGNRGRNRDFSTVFTEPGSFSGATRSPVAVDTVVYLSSSHHSSSGSIAMAPFEIGSDEPSPMPIELNDTFESFSYSGAGWAFDPSTGFPSPSIPVEPNTSIPEPSAIALFLGGAGLLVIRMRRKA